MTEFRKLTDGLSVAQQLLPEDLIAAKQAGFRTVINNRPDNESPDQPEAAALAEQAALLGLTYVHQPVISGQITDKNVDDFGEFLSSAEKPVLAFCRTGTRCTFLWALSQAAEESLDTLGSTASAAGYDLSGLMPRLQQRKNQG